MDPVSLLFSTYLETVQGNVHRHLTDSLGTDLKAIEIEYKGQSIPFQYQIWRIRDNSVCSSYKFDTTKFSKCTLSASELFNDLCKSLNKSESNHWRRVNNQRMFCNAAVSFRPTIASIAASEEESEILIAKRACNAATVAALGSEDGALIQKRKEACNTYQSLKEQAKSGQP